MEGAPPLAVEQGPVLYGDALVELVPDATLAALVWVLLALRL